MSELEFEGPSGDMKKSKYNSAFAQLYRLDTLWQEAHKFGSTINYSKLNEILDRIWLELSADAQRTTKKKVGDEDKLETINQKLLTLCIYGISEELRMEKPTLYNKIILMQKRLLMKKEMLLRKMQNDQGKGTAYEDSVEDYMG